MYHVPNRDRQDFSHVYPLMDEDQKMLLLAEKLIADSLNLSFYSSRTVKQLLRGKNFNLKILCTVANHL
jgi:hypothetical protein